MSKKMVMYTSVKIGLAVSVIPGFIAATESYFAVQKSARDLTDQAEATVKALSTLLPPAIFFGTVFVSGIVTALTAQCCLFTNEHCKKYRRQDTDIELAVLSPLSPRTVSVSYQAIT